VTQTQTNSTAARWVRASLQVNPYAYIGGKRPSSSYDSEEDYNAAVVATCVAEGIEVVAVTDHWSIDTSLDLISAAEAAGIHALPGFEATTAEGVHVLVIFPSGTAASTINSAIGTCGGSPGKHGSGSVAFAELLGRLDKDVLIIPAHANVGSGLFGRMSGQQLERAVTDPRLFVIGISPGLAPAPRQIEIRAGSGPFAREHQLAFIHADDISHPDTLATPGGSTWVKLSECSLANLTMALRAPETRVRVENPLPRSGARLREISFEGGFLDEVVIPFSDELTTIIGGRGTGKSTIVESIRFALDIIPRGRLANQEHSRMMEHVLGIGSVVTVVVDDRGAFVGCTSPNTFTIRRAADESPSVVDGSGRSVALTPLDVIGDVEIFGQHELAELAHDPVEVASMLARFAGQTGRDGAMQETERQLAENRASLLRAESDLDELNAELKDLPRLKATKTRYDESGTAARLKVVDDLAADEQRFEAAESLVSDLRASIEGLRSTGLGGRLASFEHAEPGRPAIATHRSVEAVIAQLESAMESALQNLDEAAADAQNLVAEQRTAWQAETSSLRDENQAVLRQLHEEGLEPKKYLDASRDVLRLDQSATRRAGLREQLQKLVDKRADLMIELGNHRARSRTSLQDSVRRATEAAAGDVIVQPARNFERSEFINVLDEHIVGQRSQIRHAIEAATFSAADFVSTARNSPGELGEKYSLSDGQARKVLDAGEALFREMEEITLEDAVEVKLNVAPEDSPREYRALDDLSRGQKATALLLLLLSAADTPLIIDQPEDDLDNRFIFRGIVKRLRELKGTRQLVMTTHNANIPVLGDAELLIALESQRGKGKPIHDGVGSIDSSGVRQIAEDILEGGHEAFTQRRRRYGY
jgi:DNA repair ATPase RecN